MKHLLSILLLATCLRAASPITSDRLMNWGRTNVGVIGGIPTDLLRYTNIYWDGDRDYGDDFRMVLANCPSNQYVFVNPGDYTIGGNLDYLDLGNGKVLKGAGDYRTKLRFTNGYVYVRRSGFSEEALTNYVSLAADATRGSSTVSVSNVPSWLVAGGTYILDHISDTNLVYAFGTSENENPSLSYRGLMLYIRYNTLYGETNHFENRGLGTVIKVTNIVGTTLQLEQPLTCTFEMSRTGQVAQAGYDPSTQERATRIGFEGLTIEQTYLSTDIDMFRVEGIECWWKNCTLTNSAGLRHIQFVFGYRNEVQNCWIDTSHSYASGKGYGVASYHLSTSCLIENSVFANLHAAISLDYGANNNVAYGNVVLRGISDSGQNPAYNAHGVHCYGNLAEQNYFVDKVLYDWSHGSASHNVLFRNRIRGYDGVHTEDQIPVVIEFYNRSNSVVGNALGFTGYHTNVMATATNDYCTSSTRDIYHLGFFTYGCGYGSNNFDPPAINAPLIALNWDAVTSTNNGIVRGGFSTNDLPDSLVYASAPSYWPSGRSWPVDFLHNASGFTNLPAFDKLFARTNAAGAAVTLDNVIRFRIR